MERPRAQAPVPAALASVARDPGLGTIIAAEIRLVFRTMPRAWTWVMVALTLACWLAPLGVARLWVLPFAWIWPILAWSALGAREARHGTEGLVFPAPRPLARQVTAAWLAGFAIAAVTAGGVGVRLALARDPAGAVAGMAGAAFVSSMALACGVWTGSGKLFEVLYLLLWYAGPMNRIPFLDYAATGPASVASGAPLGFGLAAPVLFAIALVGRARRLRS